MSRRAALILPVCIAASSLAFSCEASAQQRLDSQSTWRRHTPIARLSPSPLYSFTLEARFGAYYPQNDQEPALNGATPFADYFGTGAQFYFGLELDWTPIRIPYVGRLGPVFGWGFTTMNAKSKAIDSKTGKASDTDVAAATSFTIHAMHTSAVLRIDEISKRTVLPIVPYAKLGLGFGLWSSGTSAGTSKVGSDCAEKKPVSCVVAEGLSLGPHVALGGMLGLNWLDPRSSAMSRENSGIDQAYLFGEWMFDALNSAPGNSGAMHVGTSSWVLGVALDF